MSQGEGGGGGGGTANELGTTEMKRYEAEKRGERRERDCGNNAGGEEKVRGEEVNKDDQVGRT